MWSKCCCDPLQGKFCGRWMAPVQCADTDRECEIVRGFTRLQLEGFSRDLAQAETSRLDLRSAQSGCLRDRLGRAVYRQHMAVADAFCHSAGDDTRAAADLQATRAREQGKRIDNGPQPIRYRSRRVNGLTPP